MPPQNSFHIKQNTPEADKLERRLHEQLKEIWDPAADATVARYLTAMVAKGYDRKKIHAQLKAILQEAVTVQLLDWLYKHLRLHGNEYQSKEAPASSKPAPKPLPSVAKDIPTEEVELRLEDLEAEQIEDSDLEDDEATEGAAEPARAAVDAAAPAGRGDAVQSQRPERDTTAQAGPSQTTGQGGQQPQRAGEQNGGAAQAGGKPERSERRHREPIPVPNFSDVPRSRSGGGSSHAATQSAAPRSTAAPAAVPQAAKEADQVHTQADKRQRSQPHHHEQPQEEAPGRGEAPQLQSAPSGDRRSRLKSSVVLDWESWNTQKQPNEEPRGAKPSAPQARPDRAPILPRGPQDGTDAPQPLPASQREREDVRERERDRSGGSGRRRQADEGAADRPEPRHRDRDGSESARRGHERDGDGGGQRRAGEAAHRSRSRSRSRSPRARRQPRAPLGTANLLRSALGGLGAAGARGPKPSVFERLGHGAAGAAADAPPSRVSALQRVSGGPDKGDQAMDNSGSGRKRGAEDNDGADDAILGSPPKASRGAVAQKPGAGDAEAGRAAPSRAGRQRLEFAPGDASAGSLRKQHQKRSSESGPASGGPSAAEVGQEGKRPAGAGVGTGSAEASVDLNTAELEALRQQMKAMQEKLARMEAARETSPQPQPVPQPAPQPATEAVSQPAPQPAQKVDTQQVLQAAQRPAPAVLQAQVQPHQPASGRQELQMPPLLPTQPQVTSLAVRPQIRPQQQVAPQLRLLQVPQTQQRPPQPQQQQPQPAEAQQVSLASRLQPVPAAAAGLTARPVIAPQMVVGPRGVGVATAPGGGAGTSIMPTSMSDVVIEGGSGSPPRRTTPQAPVQQQPQQQQQPRKQPLQQMDLPPPAKADQQRLAAEQLDADIRSVVVENVHPLANKEILAAHFRVAGPVKNVNVVYDAFTGRPTGVAVVEMANEQATQAAAALSGSLLMDMPIGVTLKAALLLQDFSLAAMAMGAVGMGGQQLIPPVLGASVPGGQLNPAAAPFVPGQPLPAGLAQAVRPPPGLTAPGRQAWLKMGAGGRGRGSNVWVRDAARSGGATGANAGERS